MNICDDCGGGRTPTNSTDGCLTLNCGSCGRILVIFSAGRDAIRLGEGVMRGGDAPMKPFVAFNMGYLASSYYASPFKGKS